MRSVIWRVAEKALPVNNDAIGDNGCVVCYSAPMTKQMTKIILLGVLLSVSACSNKTPDLKSPCVGAEGSPCDRRPVNNDVNQPS